MWLLTLGGHRQYGFLLLSYITCFGESKLPCHKDTQEALWKSPRDKEAEASCQQPVRHWVLLPVDMRVTILEADPPAPTKHSNDCNPGWHMPAVSWGELSQNRLAEPPVNPWPTETVRRQNVCCFKQPHFRVICYMAICN